MKKVLLALPCLALAVAVFAQGSNSGGSMNPQGGSMNSQGSTSAQTSGAQSDGQLAAFIQAVNDGEISQAKTAEKSASSKAVKRFARMMLNDHRKSNTELASVEKQAGIQPEQNQDVADLTKQAQQANQQLEDQSGQGFDAAYIQLQVKEHQQALDKLDQAIGANAGRNEAVGGFLKKTRQSVAKHLELAKQLMSQSGRSGRGSSEGGETR